MTPVRLVVLMTLAPLLLLPAASAEPACVALSGDATCDDVAVALDGDSDAWILSVSLGGDAGGPIGPPGYSTVALAPQGNATGEVAVGRTARACTISSTGILIVQTPFLPCVALATDDASGGAAVAALGDADGHHVAVSATGDASACQPHTVPEPDPQAPVTSKVAHKVLQLLAQQGCPAVSGTGHAEGGIAVSGCDLAGLCL